MNFTDSPTNITEQMLHGFFVGWSVQPSPQSLLEVLRGSRHIWLAVEDERVVGFINALGDGQLSAFIPLLEVLPSHQGRGLGSELVRRMLETLADYYSVDVICDEDLIPFYERFRLQQGTAMLRRNLEPRYELRSRSI